MRVQEISGKDVRNMKARSLCAVQAGTQQIQDLRGGRGVQGVQGCLGGGLRGVQGGVQGVLGAKTIARRSRGFGRNGQKHEKTIQDFVQEVSVGQMAQGTPFRCLPWPTPPPISNYFKVLGGGEVKPPKCPTRHPRVGGYIFFA